MSEKNLKALIEDVLREFHSQHREVRKRVSAQREQGLPYSPEDVKRLGELNAIVNPLERALEALKHPVALTPDDVEKLLKNLKDEEERLKNNVGDRPSDEE